MDTEISEIFKKSEATPEELEKMIIYFREKYRPLQYGYKPPAREMPSVDDLNI